MKILLNSSFLQIPCSNMMSFLHLHCHKTMPGILEDLQVERVASHFFDAPHRENL